MLSFIKNKYKAVINLYNITRKEGLHSTWRAIKKTLRGASADENLYHNYEDFLKLHQLTDDEIVNKKTVAATFTYKPLISLIVPVYNVTPQWLDQCIESVIRQYYTNWELCLYDDNSTNQATVTCLKKWESVDSRIKIGYGQHNLHISEASNCAIAMSAGEFIGLLDNDDALSHDALFVVVAALNKNPTIDFIYSDEDKIDTNNKLSDPFFKPDFSPDLFLTNNYICHFSVIRKTLGESVGWFRKGYEGSQDYDLFLRLFEKNQKIHHISKVLYHWRKLDTSTSAQGNAKSYALQAAKQALEDYVKRNNILATVENGLWLGSFHLKYCVTTKKTIGIVRYGTNMKTQSDLRSNLASLTNICNYQNQTPQQIAIDFANIHQDYILFLSSDVVFLNKFDIDRLIEELENKNVSVVGCKMINRSGRVQHAGILIINDTAIYPYFDSDTDSTAYWGHLNCNRNYSLCSAECLLIRRSALPPQINSLNELYNHIIKNRLKTLYTPYCTCIIHSNRNSFHIDLEYESTTDQFYNKNLSTNKAAFFLNFN